MARMARTAVRPQAMDRSGRLLQDKKINLMHLVNRVRVVADCTVHSFLGNSVERLGSVT